ncbi:MAG: hypothetical protein KAR45_19190, partial [Desulfobacteraceae bacterium]|nr:hypothetical protein [Desulfobacteraceae bacterium]
VKTEWLLVNVYIGRVTDSGVRETMIDDSIIRNEAIDLNSPLTKSAMDLMAGFMNMVRYATQNTPAVENMHA